jgi:hypothetical protein
LHKKKRVPVARSFTIPPQKKFAIFRDRSFPVCGKNVRQKIVFGASVDDCDRGVGRDRRFR